MVALRSRPALVRGTHADKRASTVSSREWSGMCMLGVFRSRELYRKQ